MSIGYYRGDLGKLFEDAKATFEKLSPEEQAKLRNEQRESWVRGEMGIGNDAQEAKARQQFRDTRETAKLQGFTGDMCSNCNSMKMKMAGHCMVCEDCGTTTGCS